MTDTERPSPLNCSVRQPIAIKLDEAKSEFRTGLCVVEVKFPNVLRAEVGEIHFKNFYTAALVVKMKEKGGMVEPVDTKWRTVVKRMHLMPHPHCETGSQDYFTIKKKQMVCDIDNVVSLRFILYQPSPVWKEFRIEQIQLYKTSYQDSSSLSLPPWLTTSAEEKDPGEDDEQDAKKTPNKTPAISVPNIDQVTVALQQLWALAQKVKVNDGQNRLGRFDVEGSYEINLLSYT